MGESVELWTVVSSFGFRNVPVSELRSCLTGQSLLYIAANFCLTCIVSDMQVLTLFVRASDMLEQRKTGLSVFWHADVYRIAVQPFGYDGSEPPSVPVWSCSCRFERLSSFGLTTGFV